MTWFTGEDLDVPLLKCSNDLLEDSAAVAAGLERDGYLFFRDVVDVEAVSRLRTVYLEELVKLGIVDPGEREPKYNGADLSELPKNPVSGTIDSLFSRAPWREFVENSSVSQLMQKILGDEPYWVPIIGYRVAKPGADVMEDRLDFVHQDGFFNSGIPFLNCWFPLSEIDSKSGGIAVAEGMHKTLLHDVTKPPVFPIPVESIPASSWRWSPYRPGDLLVMHLNTPHSGITNISDDRFRFSMDLRMLPRSGAIPAIGRLSKISDSELVILEEDGATVRLQIDDNTYCRGKHIVQGARIGREDLAENYAEGDFVIVAHHGGAATVIRPAAY